MSYERLPLEYRMSSGRLRLLITMILLATPAALLPLLMIEEIPTGIRTVVSLAVVALFGWLVYGSRRSATTADIKAIGVRGFFRRRRVAWEDIQDIRAELNPAAAMQSAAPNYITFVYGRDGRKLQLPYVDDQHVSMEREMALLLDIWTELRGDDWAPDPQAAVRIDRRNARQAALLSGMSWAMLGFLPLVVIMLVPLFADLPEGLESVLSPWAVMGVGLPLIFVLTALASYCRSLRNI